jgi:hypothetical protein
MISAIQNPTLPYPSQPKSQNLEWGIYNIIEFCNINNITPPKIKDSKDNSCYGYYIFGKDSIYINLKLCRVPVKKPGFSWSYTGYKADLTPAGVCAHEFGHYLDSFMKYPSKSFTGNGEPSVSSYEPNKSESFAEMIKLFILNPDLLRVGRPKRWEFLTKRLGLKPVNIKPWREILGNADPKLIAAAQSWILRNKSI